MYLFEYLRHQSDNKKTVYITPQFPQSRSFKNFLFKADYFIDAQN